MTEITSLSTEVSEKTLSAPPEYRSVLIPRSLAEVEKISTYLAKSGLIPDALRGKPSDVAVVLMTGAELGLGPMQSLRSINVIHGKGSMSSDLMAALVMSSAQCRYLRLVESTPERAVYETWRTGQPEPAPRMGFSWEEAIGADLPAKNPTYKKYPAAMLRARAIAVICRAVYPDLLNGIYTHEEAQEIGQYPRTADPVEATIAVVPPDPAAEIDRYRKLLLTATQLSTLRRLIGDMRKSPAYPELREALGELVDERKRDLTPPPTSAVVETTAEPAEK
jgi:hypothetical protein